MKKKIYSLLDVCDFQGGTQPPKSKWSSTERNDFIRMLQIRDFTQGKESNIAYVKQTNTLKTCEVDDILIARYGASIGKILSGLNGAYNVAIVKTIPNTKKLSKRYLFHYLQSDIFQKFICNTGSRAAQAGFNKEDLKKLNIQLPDLEEQKQIVKTLDTADTLRQKRKEQLNLLDDYLKSVFFEMFGDLVMNDKGWCTNKLSEISEIVSGVTKGRKLNPENCVTVPYMRVANVQDGHINISDLKKISVLPSDVEKYRLQRGDVLLTEGGDPDKLGRGAVWCYDITDCIHQNHIFRVRISSTNIIKPLFLSWLIGSEYGKRYFLRAAKQTTGIATINSTQLKKFPVQISPIDLQNKFASIVEQVEQTKHKMCASLDKMDNHFNALMQRYFG